MKLHHTIARAYLNRSVSKFSYDDIADARKRFDKMSQAGKVTKISHVQNLNISSENIQVRVYRDTYRTAPAIMFFHGGGFVLGSIESHDRVARNLCKHTGCVVVSVGYNLAPEYKYPYQTKQAKLVYDWLTASVESLNIDKNQIFLLGDSAGASILLDFAMKHKTTAIRGTVLVYPTLDPRLGTVSMQQYASGYFLTKQMLQKFWQWYAVPKKYWPPADAKLEKLPPTLIITAEKDVLKDEARNLAERLELLKKPVEYTCYKDMLHGFLQFPGVVSKKQQAYRQIAEFINKYSG